MFTVNSLGDLEGLNIYIARPSGEILGSLNDDIDLTSVNLTDNLQSYKELSFDITADIDNKNTWFDYIQEGMQLLVEKYGWFKLDQPTETLDGRQVIKSVNAYSCESELENKNFSIGVNLGLKTSAEYLVEYDDDETELLLNPYTNVPYDWILLYNTLPEQLADLKSVYESGHFGTPGAEITVTDSELITELDKWFSLVPRLKSRITYDSSGDSKLTEYVITEYVGETTTVLSYTLTTEFPARIDKLIRFYTKYRSQLSLLDLVLEETGWTVGNIYGLSDGDYTLANMKCQIDADENKYSVLTQTISQNTRCIVTFDILNRRVNMIPVEQLGEDTGTVLSYENLVNQLNISATDDRLSTRVYVSGGDGLDIAQVNYGMSYIDDLSYKLNTRDSRGNRIYVDDALAEKYENYKQAKNDNRDAYVQYSKQYSVLASNISDIMYRVPNDGLKNDWSTYTQEELEASLKTYNNLLVTLVSLYKDDYGSAGLNEDGSVNETYIRNTMYWWDYSAYKGIIAEIECAIAVYPNYDRQDKWTPAQKEIYKDKITAWETEWSLYGTIELQAKIKTYQQNMQFLAQESVVLVSEDSDEIKSWDELSEDEKADYGNDSSNYYYDTYMEYYNLKVSAQEYLDGLQAEVDSYKQQQTQALDARTAMVKSMQINEYFTDSEADILYRLFRDADYANENIIVTNIDSTDEAIDKMLELYNDGAEQASIVSRPQLNFEIDLENLLALPDFKPMWGKFQNGNYVLVKYKDNTYVKLRMVSMSFNPCQPSQDLKITFSSYIKSRGGVSDLEGLLGNSGSVGSRGSSSSGGGSGGTYGTSDDIDVTISNTMLAQLLNSELFGTRVTNVILDTVNANAITAKSARFTSIDGGTTEIDGGRITTNSISADKLNVDTLSAITANLGNVSVANGSIGTGKQSVDDTATGFFLDSSGNVCFGDTSKYLRYKNGELELAVDSVVIGTTAVKDMIDSKCRTFSQNNEPSTGMNTGDLWIDTDDGNSLHRYDGTQWVDITDSAIKTAKMYMAFYTNKGLFVSTEDLSQISNPDTLTSSYVNITDSTVIVGNTKSSHTEIGNKSFTIKTPKENLLIINTANDGDSASYQYTFEGEINKTNDAMYLPFSVSNNYISSMTATLTVEEEDGQGGVTPQTYTLTYGTDYSIGADNRTVTLIGNTYGSKSGLLTLTYVTTDQLYNFTVGSRITDGSETEYDDLVSKGHGSSSIGNENDASGVYSFAEGLSNYAMGSMSVAMGIRNKAQGNASVALGDRNIVGKYDSTSNDGDYAFAAGQNNVATGRSSVAIGRRNNRYMASGSTDYLPVANGDYSVALGLGNVSKGRASTSVGAYNLVRGRQAFASGFNNTVGSVSDTEDDSAYSVAMGSNNKVLSGHSMAVGSGNTIESGATHGYCIGRDLLIKSTTRNQTVVGEYNAATDDGLFVVGNGADGARSNAMIVDDKGGLTLGMPYFRNYVVASSVVSIGANDEKEVTIDTHTATNGDTISDYELIGIIGISSTRTAYCSITRFFNSGNTISVTLYNNYSLGFDDLQVTVKGLYRYKA